MAKTKDRPPLEPQQVVDLLKLALNTYHDQSKKSRDADAPLASCIMIGATLEAVLTSVVCMLYDEALKTGKAPKKPLLKWDLGDLLTVAKAAKWLPKELQLDPRLDSLAFKLCQQIQFAKSGILYIQLATSENEVENHILPRKLVLFTLPAMRLMII